MPPGKTRGQVEKRMMTIRPEAAKDLRRAVEVDAYLAGAFLQLLGGHHLGQEHRGRPVILRPIVGCDA